jgi:transcription elongation GreA/GreB family factor
MKEIEATRSRLDGELRQLEERLPAAATVAKKAAGAAAGIGAVGVGLRLLMRRRKKHHADRRVRELEKRVERLEDRTSI